MPSPMKPTVWPRAAARARCVLLVGRDARRKGRRPGAGASAASVISAISSPVAYAARREARGCDQMRTPARRRRRSPSRACPDARGGRRRRVAEALGGSTKTARPTRVRPASSAGGEVAVAAWAAARREAGAALGALSSSAPSLSLRVVERRRPSAASTCVQSARPPRAPLRDHLASAPRAPARRRAAARNRTADRRSAPLLCRVWRGGDQGVVRFCACRSQSGCSGGEQGHARAVGAVAAEARTWAILRLGQRAGLVGAQHVHRAEIVNGREAFHHDLRAAMRIAPRASVTVITIGSSSGVRPTASATANRKLSSETRARRAASAARRGRENL